jgi:hypothetical protein
MHMNTETTLDFIEGRLNYDQEDFWRHHLDFCGDCTETLDEWEHFRFALKRTHLKSAPEYVLERAFHILPYQPKESVSTIRRVLASLVFDSFLEPNLAGARGLAAAARQLVLHAEGLDIHLQIWGEGDDLQLLGQLLPTTGAAGTFAAPAQLHLLRNGERIESTFVDDLGEFQFTEVPEGDLSLQVGLPHLTVVAPLNVRDSQ